MMIGYLNANKLGIWRATFEVVAWLGRLLNNTFKGGAVAFVCVVLLLRTASKDSSEFADFIFAATSATWLFALVTIGLCYAAVTDMIDASNKGAK